ncbi:cytochrome c oxidase subunit 4 [Arthrobacter sp. I2-34]|uniref:Cytochrome c oxidase polypeptide 4 n=1 Tax=Arthrobacter hankyongi TaxID=2904801 RepID=A0ABS9L6B7_9MICC|nr:cytochrome c oxidase subunit 4 [Arthrobacter hankyongi]MCG2622212.1 cytochrome c oxidase subunit 4 [Arthrobacter hankyongi]
MKIESWLFIGLVPFFALTATVYGFMVNWHEPVGYLGMFMLSGLSGMIGFYLLFTARRVGTRPEDRLDAEIHEGAGEQGHFSPWSWWPITLSAAAATGFLGLAVGWWIVYIGVGFAAVSIIGWVYEYSRGLHAH